MNSAINLGWVVILLIITSLTLTNVSDAQHKLLKNVVAMWLFDDVGNQGSIKDSSGNNHHAKLINKPKLVEGKFGEAVQFSQSKKNYLEVADHEDLRFSDVVSISAWVKRPLRENAADTAPYFILEKGQEWQRADAANYGIALHKVFKNMFYFWYADGFQGVTGIGDDNWHHYIAVAKHGDREPSLYIDGELKLIEHQDGGKKVNLRLTNSAILIGAGPGDLFDSYTDNTIDEVIIFNKALTQKDVTILGKGVDAGLLSVSDSGKLATTWAGIKQSQ